MLRPSAGGETVGCVVFRALRSGVAIGAIVGCAVLFGRAAAAQTDPQVTEFLASLNRSITELAGQAESQASSACGRIVASVAPRRNGGRSATACGETRTTVDIPLNFLEFGRARQTNVCSQRVPASLPTQSSGVSAAPEGYGL
jgi:hypothetical protein